MEFIFDCMACERKDIRQSSDIQLRYVKDKKGVAGSVQCCRDCAKLIDEDARNEKTREEKKRKTAASKAAKKTTAELS